MAARKLTPEQFPYTGPYGLPTSPHRSQGPTALALKRAMWRMGHLQGDPSAFDDHFNTRLARALAEWDPGKSGYGRGRWDLIRGARVPKGRPHAGELALDANAIGLVHAEAEIPSVQIVYPHPAGVPSEMCQGLHPTRGLPGNYAVDLCAPGGTPILAPFAGVITKLSGHDPRDGVNGDIFGWSLYLTRDDGTFMYLTHMGQRDVYVGEHLLIGQELGEVGRWPGDPGRSHSHVGITSPHGVTAAQKLVLEISAAPRVDL